MIHYSILTTLSLNMLKLFNIISQVLRLNLVFYLNKCSINFFVSLILPIAYSSLTDCYSLIVSALSIVCNCQFVYYCSGLFEHRKENRLLLFTKFFTFLRNATEVRQRTP